MRSALLRPMGDTPPPLLVAIDPGKDSGIAVFEHGTLTAAWLVRPYTETLDAAPWAAYYGDGAEVIVEIPRHYAHSKRKVDPNDLIATAARGGWLARGFRPSELWAVAPAEWKGQRTKKVDNARTLNILTLAENATIAKTPKGKLHNVLDAIGIGLWLLGRKPNG